MKNLLTLSILTALGASPVLGALTIGVDLVTDGSFEDVSGPSNSAGNIGRNDSWFEINETGGSDFNDSAINAEAFQVSGAPATPTPIDSYWLNLAPRDNTTPAAVYQALGVWNTGDPLTFDFSATIAERTNGNVFGDVSFDLYATAGSAGGDGINPLGGATLVGNLTSVTSLTDGTYDSPAGITGSATISGINDGDTLWLVIANSSTDSQALIDGVSVVAPIPEPSALILLGTGLVAGFLLLRRRR